MAEYIERTAELILAVNAGARVIENTKRYHGASYCVDIFAEKPKEIAYLKAAEVLRGFDEIPAADVAPVVRCKDCVWYKPAHFDCDDGKEYPWDGIMRLGERTDGIYVGAKCKHERNTAYGYKDMAFRKPDDFCSYGERREDG